MSELDEAGEPLEHFEAIYRDESPYVASLLLRLGLPRATVPDVTQEVFITAFRRWSDYDPTRPIRAWLYGIARKLAFRSRRSDARNRRKLGALSAASSSRDATHDGARGDAATAKVLLHRLVEELDDDVAEVFLLADFGGYTAKEVADQTGLNCDQVYYRLRVARKHLRAALDEDTRDGVQSSRALVPAWAGVAAQLTPTASGALALSGLGLGLGTKVAAAVATIGAAWWIVATPPAPPPDPSPSGASSPAVVTSAASVAGGPAQGAPLQEPAVETSGREPPTVDAPEARRHTRTRTTGDTNSVSAASLERERSLLVAARQASAAGDFERALSLYAQHEAQHPEGELVAARRRGRIVTLCASGKAAAARGEALAWARRAPDDPLAAQAVELCPTSDSQNPSEPEK